MAKTAPQARARTIPVAEFIKNQIRLSGRSQSDVAKELGYAPNLMAMISNGNTRLPLNKVPALAQALGVDEMALMRMAITEYDPVLWEVLDRVFRGRLVTEAEGKLIKEIREAAGGIPEDVDLEFTDAELRQIGAIANKAGIRTVEKHRAEIEDFKTALVQGKASDKVQRVTRVAAKK
ncbi:helix-turn-helix domain-containing protein [Cupriavidus metallidurans]|uniref:helix-turn-helix domain-containing protein n=1 Tax=Cupriavidus metallidurans TaxID=119219 RepID=UPI001CCE2E75|nr:helix-turn-helix transcriptional regulator [Cupriavidus metallidurans]UBM12728.1 helix-turn-helix domain-containing protein [Cupriavidus metallidurans]